MEMKRRDFLRSTMVLGTIGGFGIDSGRLATSIALAADGEKTSELTKMVVGSGRIPMRVPSTPLITCDPYFSVWSADNNLTDGWSRHWTGAANAIALMVRVDGKTFRLSGMAPEDVPALPLVQCSMSATTTAYQYDANGVHIELRFCTPVLIEDPELVGRPASYLTWNVTNTDRKDHEVTLYYDNSGEFVVNEPSQEMTWETPQIDGLTVRAMKSADQKVLGRSGDNLRIEWGTFYVATESDAAVEMKILGDKVARNTFAKTGAIAVPEDNEKPRPAGERWPVIACVWNVGTLDAGETATRSLTLAYDDEYSIRFLGENLRPWWRRNGTMDGATLVRTAVSQRAELSKRAAAFDEKFAEQTSTVGGPKYEAICTVAYRQVIAAHKLCAGPKGEMMLFSKECYSNGCIGTVDILYPTSPIFAFFNNDLLKATVTPIFEYVASGRWKFPFAPHDIGQYPLADGQVYGGGEKTEENQMPVEESGNMMIVAGMIARNDGNVDYLKPYMEILDTWAAYLREKGLDPENQLCTDDFAGHLAHNANLSIKAIVALAVYAKICRMDGRLDRAEQYEKLAKELATQWKEMAADGDHYKLAFDKPGTWSQKYNIVWDKVFQLGLFDPEIAKTELEYYKTKFEKYGLPLDNRSLYTKADWEIWTATLAEKREDFDTYVAYLFQFLNDTSDRVPFSDWYWTDSAKMRGFQHRAVVGGIFIPMMERSPIE